MNKLKAFEFFTDCLVTWHNEVNSEVPIDTSFNKLKLIKLHFFATAVQADNDNPGLLDIFNNFYALPLGHVESNIYDLLPTSTIIKVTKSSFKRLPTDDDTYFNEIEPLQSRIEEAVAALRDVNQELIKYNALELVEISHRWHSWSSTFEMARSLGKFSLRIPTPLIQRETKYFTLNQHTECA